MGKPFDPTESRRREEMVRERASESQRLEAYKQGVMEVSRHPVVFVDPDNIREIDMRFSQRPPYHRNPGYHLQRQMDGQVPGATEGLMNRINEGNPEPESLNSVAREMRESGPAALSRVTINGTTYGVIVLPEDGLDTKDELIRGSFKHLDRDTRNAIVSNMPGTDLQWMRFIGNHEGEHLNKLKDGTSRLETLAEEVRADRTAYKMAVDRGEGDVALAFRDYRALRAFYDPTHASSPLVASNDPVNPMHFDAADNSLTRMHSSVALNFDWSTYTGKATTADELLKENPEAYFGAMQKGIDLRTQQVMANYNADPKSLDAQRQVVQAQIQIDYAKDFEDAYRRRVLGQDVPAREPTQLITQAQEDAYFKEVEFQGRVGIEKYSVEREAYAAYPEERIFQGVDLAAEGEGIETPSDLWDANPVRYHEVQQERLSVLKDEALAAHAENPSYENLERLVQLEHVIDSNENSLDRERYIAANPGASMAGYTPIPQVTIISDEMRHSYYEQRFAQKDAGTWVPPSPYEPPPAPEAAAAPSEPIYALPGVIPEAELLVAGEALLTYNDDVVFEGVDWDKVDGPATSADELFIQNPRLYTEITAQRLEALSETVLADYKANPSYENLEKVVQIEMAMNQTNVFLAARQSADDPAAAYQQPTPVSLISEGERAGYYEARMQQEALKAEPADAAPVEAAPPEPKTEGAATEQPAETVPEQKAEGGIGAHLRTYTPGVDGTAYTTVVAGLQGGQPLVDFSAENRITVGGLSMGSLFASSADPDPSSVSMINARLGAPEEALPDASMQMGQDASASAAFRAPA